MVLKHIADSLMCFYMSKTSLFTHMFMFPPLFFNRSRNCCRGGERDVSVFPRTVGADAGAAGVSDVADWGREAPVHVRERLRAPRTLHGESIQVPSSKTRSTPTICLLNNTVCIFFLQVDLVAQGDSVYDIIDASDHFIMRTNLATSTSPEIGKKKMIA